MVGLVVASLIGAGLVVAWLASGEGFGRGLGTSVVARMRRR
jgi:hypothetical protein